MIQTFHSPPDSYFPSIDTGNYIYSGFSSAIASSYHPFLYPWHNVPLMGLSCIVNPTSTCAFIPASCLLQHFFIISESVPHNCHGMVGYPPHFIWAAVYHHGRAFKLVGRSEARSRRQTISGQRRSLSIWFINCYRCGLCCFSLVDR